MCKLHFASYSFCICFKWVETIAFHSKILAQVPFAGYFILCRRLPKLLFSMKTLKWWIICLISYLGSFKIYFSNLHVLCLFPWFFFISCVGCFTNIWEIEAKILIFQKIITTYRISVSKMISAGFFWSSFFPHFYSEPSILQTCGCFGNKV